MISFESSGSFDNLESFLKVMGKHAIFNTLDKFGRQGVDALAINTPVDSGNTASSWSYKVEKNRGAYTITWLNSNTADGIPVAILLQLGHGTGTGGYVSGRDYINPAIKPIFDQIADEAWMAVTKA